MWNIWISIKIKATNHMSKKKCRCARRCENYFFFVSFSSDGYSYGYLLTPTFTFIK